MGLCRHLKEESMGKKLKIMMTMVATVTFLSLSGCGKKGTIYEEDGTVHLRMAQASAADGAIGISPLSTPHPHPFQRMWVRSSTTSYGSFNRDMDRSPGFGSTPTDSGPIKTWFPYGSTPSVLNLASMHNSPDRSTKSTRFLQ